MDVRIVLIGLALLGVSCENNSKHIQADSTDQLPLTQVEKETLFRTNCASCHGMDGKLGLSGAKDLTQTKLTNTQLKKLIQKGKNGMPPFEDLIPEANKIEALVETINALKK
jgi:cytochrome c6